MLDLNETPNNIGQYNKSQRVAILKAGIDHRNLIDPQANIHLIDRDDLEHHIQNNVHEGRQRAVIAHQGHYMAADILVKGDQRSCILLDAANDFRCNAVMNDFENQGFTVLMATSLSADVDRNLQSDTFNCSMFSLDHCIQFCTAPDELHSDILAQSEMGGFTWDRLPPNFIWNVQSSGFITTFMAANPELVDKKMPNGLSMREYIDQGTRIVDGKPSNMSVDVHVFKNAHQAHLSFEAVNEIDLNFEASQKMGVKNEILLAMDKSIQTAKQTGWAGQEKPAKIARLLEIRQQFSQNREIDPLRSPLVTEFNQVAGQDAFVMKTNSVKMFQSEMKKIRQQYEPDNSKTVANDNSNQFR